MYILLRKSTALGGELKFTQLQYTVRSQASNEI
jgi:hypothetical protein